MSFREVVNKYQWVVIAAVVAILAAVAWSVYAQVAPSGPAIQRALYFTTDDGATYYPDDAGLVPPYAKDGKQAVRALVYECNGKPFVAYVARYTPDAKAIVEKYRADLKTATNGPPPNMMQAIAVQQSGWESKKPGAKDWQRGMPGAASGPKCDTGSPANSVQP